MDRVALYLRVSMEDQDVSQGARDESNSIGSQRALLRDFVDRRPEFRGCHLTEFCDDGYSGTNFERPAVKALLEQAGKKQIDCMIVKDFSRFGRDYLTVSDYVDQIFPFLGIRFISVNDGYDSVDYQGTTSGVDMAFRNVVYAYYSKDISEKEKTAKRTKASRGAYLASFAPVGYRKDSHDKNHLVVDPEGADIVGRIFHLAGAGIPVVVIARIFSSEGIPTPSVLKKSQGFQHKWWESIHGESLWDTSTITRILRDERYLGKNVYGKRTRLEVGNYKGRRQDRDNWIIVPDCHEPIVTEEEFQLAQDMLKDYTKAGRRRPVSHLFRGKVRCGGCGYALVREGKEQSRYRCVTSKRTSRFPCISGSVSEAWLAGIVWAALGVYCDTVLEKKVCMDRQERGAAGDAIRKQIRSCRSASQSLDEQKAVLYEQMLDGELDRQQYLQKRTILTEKQDHIKLQIQKLEEKMTEQEQQKKEIPPDSMINLYLHAEKLTREIVDAFVDCIYVYGDERIHIDWRFQMEGIS